MSIFRDSYFPLYTTKEDVDLLFEMVRKSNYVAGNPDYNRKAQNTKIYFREEDNSINANAGSYDEDSHRIQMLNGLCNTIRFTAVALAYFKEYGEEGGGVGRIALAMRWLGNKIIEDHYSFPISSIEEGLNNMEYDTNGIIGIESKSYSAGGILAVLAHEQGHICLSHTLRSDWSNEVSRNDERQADLFGCNVSITTPFASSIVLATLFVEVVFSWMSGNKEIATTHPASRERVYNTIDAHDTILKELGITKENIEYFLPRDEDIPEEPEKPEDSDEPEETEE
jgi:hypothetical protein